MSNIEIVRSVSGGDNTHIIKSALEIESTLIIKDQLLKEGKSIAEHGLLISKYTEDYVAKMLKDGGAVYLANHQGKPAGYIFVAPGSYFKKELSQAKVIWPDNDTERKFRSMLSSDDARLIKQIGIMREYHGKGVAQALIESLEMDMKGCPLTAYIATSPIDNVRSKAFFRRNGYLFIADAVFPDYRGIKDFRVVVIIKGYGSSSRMRQTA